MKLRDVTEKLHVRPRPPHLSICKDCAERRRWYRSCRPEWEPCRVCAKVSRDHRGFTDISVVVAKLLSAALFIDVYKHSFTLREDGNSGCSALGSACNRDMCTSLCENVLAPWSHMLWDEKRSLDAVDVLKNTESRRGACMSTDESSE